MFLLYTTSLSPEIRGLLPPPAPSGSEQRELKSLLSSRAGLKSFHPRKSSCLPLLYYPSQHEDSIVSCPEEEAGRSQVKWQCPSCIATQFSWIETWKASMLSNKINPDHQLSLGHLKSTISEVPVGYFSTKLGNFRWNWEKISLAVQGNVSGSKVSPHLSQKRENYTPSRTEVLLFLRSLWNRDQQKTQTCTPEKFRELGKSDEILQCFQYLSRKETLDNRKPVYLAFPA